MNFNLWILGIGIAVASFTGHRQIAYLLMIPFITLLVIWTYAEHKMEQGQMAEQKRLEQEEQEREQRELDAYFQINGLPRSNDVMRVKIYAVANALTLEQAREDLSDYQTTCDIVAARARGWKELEEN